MAKKGMAQTIENIKTLFEVIDRGFQDCPANLAQCKDCKVYYANSKQVNEHCSINLLQEEIEKLVEEHDELREKIGYEY